MTIEEQDFVNACKNIDMGVGEVVERLIVEEKIPLLEVKIILANEVLKEKARRAI